MSSEKKIFIKDSAYITSVNLLAMIVSVLMSIVLPKFISTDNYGFWQLFILYSSYTGFFHFGYCDGVYLKYGGKNFNRLPYNLFSSQFKFFVLFQIAIAILIVIYGLMFINSPDKQFIIIACSLYLFISNICTLFSFVLMATNRIKEYSKGVFISKIILVISIIILLLFDKSLDYKKFIFIYLFSITINLIYLIPYFKRFIFESFKINFKAVKMMMPLLYAGFILTLSNIVWNLVMGGGRLFVEFFWDIKEFAKVSLAISFSMFLVAFISQISVVLFPVLRNSSDTKVISILNNGNTLIGVIMSLSYLFIIPIQFIISNWLPGYSESILYIIYFLPMSLYLIKTGILYITTMKNLNKQSSMLLINAITFLIAIILYYFSSKLRSLEYIVASMAIVCFLRSLLMEYFVNKNYGLSFRLNEVFELIIAVLFIFIYKTYDGNLLSLLIFILSSCLLYFILFRKDIMTLYNFVFR